MRVTGSSGASGRLLEGFGFRLNEAWGKIAAYLWIAGFSLTFMPLYVVGLMGMPRRTVAYTDPTFEPYVLVAVFGAAVILSASLPGVVGRPGHYGADCGFCAGADRGACPVFPAY